MSDTSVDLSVSVLNSETIDSENSSEDSLNYLKELDLNQMSDISGEEKLKQVLSQMRQMEDKKESETIIADPLTTEAVDQQIDKTMEALIKTVNQLRESIGDNRSNYLSTDLMPRLHELNEKILFYLQNEYKYLRNSFIKLKTLSTISNRLFGFLDSGDSSEQILDMVFNTIEDKEQTEDSVDSPLFVQKITKRRTPKSTPKRSSYSNQFYYCYTDGCGGRQYYGLSSIQKHIDSVHLKPKAEDKKLNSPEFQPYINLTNFDSKSLANKTPKKTPNKTPKKAKTQRLSGSSTKKSKAVPIITWDVYICRTDDCDYRCYMLDEMQSHIQSAHFKKV